MERNQKLTKWNPHRPATGQLIRTRMSYAINRLIEASSSRTIVYQ